MCSRSWTRPGHPPRQHQLSAPESGRLCGSPPWASPDRAGNAEARAKPPHVFFGHSRPKSQGPISLSLPSSPGQPGLLQPHATRKLSLLDPPPASAPPSPLMAPRGLTGARFWLVFLNATHLLALLLCQTLSRTGWGRRRLYTRLFSCFPCESLGLLALL